VVNAEVLLLEATFFEEGIVCCLFFVYILFVSPKMISCESFRESPARLLDEFSRFLREFSVYLRLLLIV
jgi:hypothetical protein